MIAFCLAATDHGPMLLNRLDYNRSFNGVYGVGAQLLENGAYDPRDVEMLRNLLLVRREHFGDGVVALDCGANIGVHTLEWARVMKGWGNVIAIEAQERIYYALAGNIVLQNCFNARAIWAAVAAEAGTISFPEPDYTRQSSFGSFELRPRAGGEFIGQPVDYGSPDATVESIAIDSLNLARLDLLKIDVEGMEAEALAGAKDTIARCRPVLFVEVIKSDRELIEQALHNEGYRIIAHGMNILAVHRSDPTLGNIAIEREAA